MEDTAPLAEAGSLADLAAPVPGSLAELNGVHAASLDFVRPKRASLRTRVRADQAHDHGSLVRRHGHHIGASPGLTVVPRQVPGRWHPYGGADEPTAHWMVPLAAGTIGWAP
jgi:hypothetical protein